VTIEGGRVGWRVHAALLGVQLFFGLWPLFGKWAMTEVSPLAITLLRIAGTAGFLSALAASRGGLRFSRRDLPRFALFGLLGAAGNQTLFILGLQRTSIVHATILTATIPALTLAAAAILGRERPGVAKLAGVALAFSGIVVLVGNAAGLSSGSLLGDLLIVVNSSMYSFYLVLSKDDFVRRGTFGVLPAVFIAGTVMVLPVCLPAALSTPWATLSPRSVASLAYILIFATIGAYGLNAYALGRAPASTVAAYVYLQPAIAMASAAVVLREPIGFGQLFALALVVAGTLLATRKAAPAAPPPPD
jgi:drug/metabolite transporter (DMT)-like permease